MMALEEERVEIHRPLMRKIQGMEPFVKFSEKTNVKMGRKGHPSWKAFNSNPLDMTTIHRTYYMEKEENLYSISGVICLIEKIKRKEKQFEETSENYKIKLYAEKPI
eukprot:TRINITY_DN2413_c0_g2_i1.p1 TRINITY_DN2413_c0_g2~~TRINITY_DN2413_c0_g2_i1.p1  ORF type:complete len:107 (-),score=21.43 TRINITY_DN2413_c0_g2_i1:372-692(-)